MSRAERINKLLEHWRAEASKTAGGPPSLVPLKLVDMLASNPFLTVKKAASHLGVAFTTAQRGIDRLEKVGVLHRVNEAKRGRVYCAKQIFDILEEPARIAPLS